jgi:iron complex transport system substrate-binding protein
MNVKRQAPLRVVSLAPSATSILCAIGAKHSLVGVTKWCADIARVADLPKLGDCWHMESVNEILRLKPNLVIGSVPYKQETVAELLKHPVNFLAMNPRSLSDIKDDIRLLGHITGHVSGANRTVRAMRAGFARILKKSKRKQRRVRVYCEAWPNPRISSPPWVTEIVNLCGGETVVPAGERVTDEQVAEAMPEIIVLAWTATGGKADPGRAYRVAAWKDVPAIRDGKVCVIRDELLNTPGPPVVEGARELWKVLNSQNRRGY